MQTAVTLGVRGVYCLAFDIQCRQQSHSVSEGSTAWRSTSSADSSHTRCQRGLLTGVRHPVQTAVTLGVRGVYCLAFDIQCRQQSHSVSEGSTDWRSTSSADSSHTRCQRGLLTGVRHPVQTAVTLGVRGVYCLAFDIQCRQQSHSVSEGPTAWRSTSSADSSHTRCQRGLLTGVRHPVQTAVTLGVRGVYCLAFDIQCRQQSHSVSEGSTAWRSTSSADSSHTRCQRGLLTGVRHPVQTAVTLGVRGVYCLAFDIQCRQQSHSVSEGYTAWRSTSSADSSHTRCQRGLLPGVRHPVQTAVTLGVRGVYCLAFDIQCRQQSHSVSEGSTAWRSTSSADSSHTRCQRGLLTGVRHPVQTAVTLGVRGVYCLAFDIQCRQQSHSVSEGSTDWRSTSSADSSHTRCQRGLLTGVRHPVQTAVTLGVRGVY